MQTEHQKKVASSDWTNVIIPGEELFTGGQQTVRWRLDNLEENTNYECLVQVRLIKTNKNLPLVKNK